MKYTIDEYSKKIKMSKEMINSKIKSKKLHSVIEDNIRYILVKEPPLKTTLITKKPTINPPAKQKTTVATIISLYQKENKQLKDKIIQLENKIDKLIDDKEQMLRDERDKIEHLYSSKDEQLKNILELVNTKILMQQNYETIHETDAIDTIEQKKEESSKIIELRDYLKTLDLKASQKKTIKKRFSRVYNSDIRIMQQNGKLYLDLLKYDYSDLLEI